MTPGARDRLYTLSFDHRASFEKEFMRITDTPTAEAHRRIAQLKAVINNGFSVAITIDACAVAGHASPCPAAG